MPDLFTLTTEPRGPAVVVRVAGRLDARTSPQLLQRCAPFKRPRAHVVLDLGRVTFLSSSGVGALLALTEDLRERQGSLRLAPVSAEVGSAIRLLNLEPFLSIHETEEQALAALGEAA